MGLSAHRSIPLLHQLDALVLPPPAVLVHVELSGPGRRRRRHDVVLYNVLGRPPEPGERVRRGLVRVRRFDAALGVGKELVELDMSMVISGSTLSPEVTRRTFLR
jgi:hypothetical protein